ncbi:MAG: GNAT family N-acetyltransferase [Caldilineaceae bacterium]|nr:GNAT family N-acetyltransferase [Caldilineaceae bacterium]
MSEDPELTYVETPPTPEEYNHLRKTIGWGGYADLADVARGLQATCFCVSVYQAGEIVAMGRVIGDGVLVFYIQDVIVLPEYQKRGIGAQIMSRIMDYIDAHAVQNSYVGLMSAIGKEGFYDKFGFTRRPTDKLGCGMTLVVSR